MEKYKSPWAFVLLQCEVFLGESCFPLFHPSRWALVCAHPVPVSFQLSQAWWGRWSSASEVGYFFLMGGFLARSPGAARSKCNNSGSLDGSPSLLELCWSRVAPGEENKEEEKEERIQKDSGLSPACRQRWLPVCQGHSRDAQLQSSLSPGDSSLSLVL